MPHRSGWQRRACPTASARRISGLALLGGQGRPAGSFTRGAWRWRNVAATTDYIGRIATGDSVQVSEKQIPFFKTGKQLRDRLNPADSIS